MIDVTEFVETLGNKPVAVFGIGMSNIAAIKALTKAGAAVVAWDDNPEKRDNAKDAGAKAKNFTDEDPAAYALLVMAPGVPLEHAAVKWAQGGGLEVIGDLEILHRCGHSCRTIGVTGTNGKSTTTALIGHILDECGFDIALGGNIGKPVLDLDMPGKDGFFVFEISSFQLELCPTFAPDIAVLLNISADHLDRHGNVENYTAAKKKIFRGPGQAVICLDDDHCRKIYDQLETEGLRDLFPTSVTRKVDSGVYVEDKALYDGIYAEAQKVFDIDIVTLPGAHNAQNAAAAYTVARLLNIGPDKIHEAMKSFPGLPHRQYLVRTINGVAYINDSKATNAAAAGRALSCYNNIYWILGGRSKEGGLNGLEAYTDNIRHAFLIGEAADEFAVWLNNYGVAHSFSGTMENAVADAHRLAQSERGQPGGTGTVLLSPACASFDQFNNFEQRGDKFTALVNDLKEAAT